VGQISWGDPGVVAAAAFVIVIGDVVDVAGVLDAAM
jgi:hypothetical protein